jgi:hypothetical protein
MVLAGRCGRYVREEVEKGETRQVNFEGLLRHLVRVWSGEYVYNAFRYAWEP